MVNMTCPVEHAQVDPVPFYQDGKLNFKAHDVGWIVSGFFALTASVISFWLIWKHLTYYTCPPQQRHIVRMLFMVPIYAVVSWASYFWYHEAIYYQTVRDCYEAVVITSFFYLLLQYLADTPAEQLEVFRMVELKKWVWPFGRWKYRPSGLHFLWLMKICILQYAIVRPVCTLAAVGLQYFGYYCLESWMPWFGHIWIAVIISVSVSVAMYCLIQLYMPVQAELKPYSPILKFLAVKSVVFLTFWQDSFLSLLVVFGAIKPAQYMTAPEIQVGINALLQTLEMFIFSLVHIKAFTYLIYRPRDRSRTTKRWAAIKDAMNFSDWFTEMRATTSYLSAHRKGRDWTYVDDVRRVKYEHLEKALGRERWGELQRERDAKKLKHRSFFKDGGEDQESEDLEAVANSSTATRTVQGSTQGTRAKDKRDPAKETTPPSKPRGNRALRGDFDPEKDEGDLEGDEDEEREAPQEGEALLMREPTLPRLGYRPRAAPGADTHPELSWYHGPGRSTVGLDEGDEAVAPRSQVSGPEDGGGDRDRRQGSGSLGAWWRTISARFTGSEDGRRRMEQVPHDDVEEEEEEKRGMLAAEMQTTPLSPTSPHNDSPLARFIAASQSEQRNAEEEKRRQLLSALEPSPVTSQIKASEAVLVRQDSTAVSDRAAFDQAAPSRQAATPAPSTATSTQQLQHQHLESHQSKLPSSTQARPGPKGRKISLILPTPLSPEDFRPAAPAMDPTVHSECAPTVLSEPRRTSEVRFAESERSMRSSATPQRRAPAAAPSEMVKAAGPKHRVVQGARSLAQVRAEELAARKAEEQAELEEAREARQSRDQEEQQRAMEMAARRHKQQQQELYEAQRLSKEQRPLSSSPPSSSSSGRPRRTSAPAAPRPSEVLAVQPPTKIEKKWWGKKKITPAPYTPLPAPSQLATDVGDVQDAFTAAGTTVSALEETTTAAPGGRTVDTRRQSTGSVPAIGPLHPGVGGSRNPPSIKVGAIVSSHAMIDAAWQQQQQRLPPPRPYPNAPGMPGSAHRWPYAPLRPAPRHSAPVTAADAYLYSPSRPGPQPLPSPHSGSTFGVSTPRHSGSGLRPGSAGGGSRPSFVDGPRASYHRYTGEPVWTYSQHPPSSSRGTATSQPRSAPRYETREGFSFDYID